VDELALPPPPTRIPSLLTWHYNTCISQALNEISYLDTFELRCYCFYVDGQTLRTFIFFMAAFLIILLMTGRLIKLVGDEITEIFIDIKK
jgi:hypothetical protein